MWGKIEVMDDIWSQRFARKLEQYFSIFVSQIQAKSQNQMAVKECIFWKNYFSEEVEPRNLNLLRKSFTAIIFKNLPSPDYIRQ